MTEIIKNYLDITMKINNIRPTERYIFILCESIMFLQ